MLRTYSVAAALLGLVVAGLFVAETPALVSFGLATAAAVAWGWWIDES